MRITRTGGGRGRRAAAMATTVLTASALLLTGCSSDDGDSDAADSNGNITLKLADFGQFGYKEAGLFEQYHKLHPNITVKEETTAEEQQYYPKFLQQLNSNSGLGDVTGIEVGRIKEVVDTQAGKFTDLSKSINVSDWVSWKEKQATAKDGSVIGAGTDIGPMSLCYRKDLFEKAGLPTDREAVAKAVAGGWEDYLKLGEQYQKKAPSGTHFMDSASAMYNAVVSSSAKQYYDADGKPIYKDSPAVQQGWNLAAETASKKLSAGLPQFGVPWQTALRKGQIASMVCPAWMAAQISTYSGDSYKGKWDISRAPGTTAANWGGSF
ncbi:ABC transporter substrate-binding protein, partial [Kitasatospora sp. NPDC018614]